ncbi:putative reverse transcriptase domain-containing protein [Tanacetum coccineum]
MTRSSTNELFTPFEEPEREFQSSRRHFKTLSLDELRSPDFDLFSDQEYLEEEVADTMAETIEQYTSKTRADYGLGEVILFYNGLGIPTRHILDSRGAIPSNTAADVKVAIQEMAEYSQKWHNGTSRARIGCEQCTCPHYTKDFPLKKEGKTLEEAYYTQFSAPFQGGGYRAAAPGFYQRNNVNPSYQERRQSMEDTLRKFMSESTKRHEENSNLIKEIRASMDVAIRNQRASIKTLEIQIGQIIKDLATVKYPKGIAENVLVGIGKFVFPVDFIILDMPEDIKVPLILGRPFLSTVHAKIDVYKRKITLSLKERMELDLEARIIGETLVLNRLLVPFFEDYIELNDLNEPFELRRYQGDDLMPTIEKGEVIEEFRTRNDKLDTGINDYPSYCDFLEDIDAYRDEGMGDVIVGEPFLKEIRIKVSEQDMRNGISHPYQKLKGFYKGVLNLRPDYIRDAKTEEWLKRRHVSVHEMEW